MPEPEVDSFNKWGAQTRPFMSRPERIIEGMLDHTEQVVGDVAAISGAVCFVSYGTLLGAVRDGDLIPHDDDIDLAVWLGESNVESVAIKMRAILAGLLDRGYQVKGRSLGQVKIHKRVDGRRRTAELFACWREGDRLYHYFAVPGFDYYEEFARFEETSVRGRTFVRPGKPEVLLAYMYGPNWRVPDPYFKYELTREMWRPFKPLFFSRGRVYWDTYYKDELSRGESAVSSPFVTEIGQSIDPGTRVLELGSGLGADALLLAEAGAVVTATDYSEVAVSYLKEHLANARPTATVQVLNLYDVAETKAFAAEHQSDFDLVVARFVIEEVSEACELSIWELIRGVLSEGGSVAVELRVCQPSKHAALPKRRTVRALDLASVCDRAHEMGLRCVADSSYIDSECVEVIRLRLVRQD